jgi:hypothetical protein
MSAGTRLVVRGGGNFTNSGTFDIGSENVSAWGIAEPTVVAPTSVYGITGGADTLAGALDITTDGTLPPVVLTT